MAIIRPPKLEGEYDKSKYCSYECSLYAICDFCSHYKHDLDEKGYNRGHGKCYLHGKKSMIDFCNDFECFRLKDK